MTRIDDIKDDPRFKRAVADEVANRLKIAVPKYKEIIRMIGRDGQISTYLRQGQLVEVVFSEDPTPHDLETLAIHLMVSAERWEGSGEQLKPKITADDSNPRVEETP